MKLKTANFSLVEYLSLNAAINLIRQSANWIGWNVILTDFFILIHMRIKV